MYTVSCKQLGCPPTKEGSLAAANDWWEAKLKEIEAASPTEEERSANAFRVWWMVQDWGRLDEESREKPVDSLVGAGQYRKIKAQAGQLVDAAVKAPTPDRTVKAQVDAWQMLLHGVCRSGQMSEGRFDTYCRNIGNFVR
jgi:hypothetical protein